MATDNFQVLPAEALRLAEMAFENRTEGIAITDANMQILRINRSFSCITGYSEQELRDYTPLLVSHHRNLLHNSVWASLGESGMWEGEIWSGRRQRPYWLSIVAVRNGHGQVTNYIGVARDLFTQRAGYDALTGFPNRSLLEARLQRALLRAQLTDTMVGILLIDIERFKTINEVLGYRVGDLFLNTIAQKLKAKLLEGGILSRFGEDEFCMVLRNLIEPNQAMAVATQILEDLKHPLVIEGYELVPRANIGISLFPRDGEDALCLLNGAYLALHRAKEMGRDTFQFYSTGMNEGACEWLAMERNLRLALKQDELFLHFQPQIDMKTGRIIGAEALVRWLHPEQGVIPPAKFIPLAENTGLIVPLGEWVLTTACRQAKAWHDSGHHSLRMAVNLSAHQFMQQDLMQVVQEALNDSGLDPACLELELTESMLLHDPEQAISTLQELRSMGVTVALDDFGTGYSNLGYLRRLPIDKLKIDRSFVQEISCDPNDGAIVKAVIALGHSMKLKVTAEGVETQGQLEFLRKHGCHYIQGYYFSPAVSGEAMAALLRVQGAGQTPACRVDAAPRRPAFIHRETVVGT